MSPLNTDPGANPFARSQMSWPASLVSAILLEGALAGFLIAGAFGAVPAFRGADNPLVIYVGFVLQFPASLLFVPFAKLSETFAAVVVFLLEGAFFLVLFRKPWRNREPEPRPVR